MVVYSVFRLDPRGLQSGEEIEMLRGDGVMNRSHGRNLGSSCALNTSKILHIFYQINIKEKFFTYLQTGSNQIKSK